jgi:hypothetical protein
MGEAGHINDLAPKAGLAALFIFIPKQTLLSESAEGLLGVLGA